MELLYDILHVKIIMVSMFDLDKLNLYSMIYNQIWFDLLPIIRSNLKAAAQEVSQHPLIQPFQNQALCQRNKVDYEHQHRVQE